MFAQALKLLGAKRAFVVHGCEGALLPSSLVGASAYEARGTSLDSRRSSPVGSEGASNPDEPIGDQQVESKLAVVASVAGGSLVATTDHRIKRFMWNKTTISLPPRRFMDQRNTRCVADFCAPDFYGQDTHAKQNS